MGRAPAAGCGGGDLRYSRVIAPRKLATVTRVVSGGQTGADRGALDAAIALGLEHGGYCPRGRLAEDGVIPARYQLTETSSAEYAQRTERNVIEADGTLLVTRGAPTGGSALTARLARARRKPLLSIDLDLTSFEDAADAVRRWLAAHRIATLNVAGSRASRTPTLADDVRRLLEAALNGSET
jgi:hypothetical protein